MSWAIKLVACSSICVYDRARVIYLGATRQLILCMKHWEGGFSSWVSDNSHSSLYLVSESGLQIRLLNVMQNRSDQPYFFRIHFLEPLHLSRCPAIFGQHLLLNNGIGSQEACQALLQVLVLICIVLGRGLGKLRISPSPHFFSSFLLCCGHEKERFHSVHVGKTHKRRFAIKRSF